MGKNRIRKNVSIMIDEFVREALCEDVGRGDLYALIEPAINASAKIIAKIPNQGYIYTLTNCCFCCKKELVYPNEKIPPWNCH